MFTISRTFYTVSRVDCIIIFFFLQLLWPHFFILSRPWPNLRRFKGSMARQFTWPRNQTDLKCNKTKINFRNLPQKSLAEGTEWRLTEKLGHKFVTFVFGNHFDLLDGSSPLKLLSSPVHSQPFIGVIRGILPTRGRRWNMQILNDLANCQAGRNS